MADAPPDFQRKLAANEDALRALAGTFGGEVRPIDPALRAAWVAPDAEWEPVRVLLAERCGAGVAAVANTVRVTSSGSKTSYRLHWRAQHVLAVRLAGAEVPSVLHTVEHVVPLVGPLRVPHFAHASSSSDGQANAWTLPPPYCTRALHPPWRFTGCPDGVLYAFLDRDELDAATARVVLEALLVAAKLPWRAPTPEERAERAAASIRRARLQCVAGCMGLLALAGLGAVLLRHVLEGR